MTNRASGPHSWVLDDSVKDSPTEQILRRCEGSYDEINSRLCKAIAAMQAANDGDALLLLEQMMLTSIRDIRNYFTSKPIEVQPDAVKQ